jgi:hypothetical protein
MGVACGSYEREEKNADGFGGKAEGRMKLAIHRRR